MSSDQKRVLLQVGLFIATFITTTIAGAEWAFGRSILMPDYTWQDFFSGLEFSIPFLLFLTCHEFGHYFTARFHKIKVTLPYYLPIPTFLLPNPIGTLGAVIRIKERIYSKTQNFDIGLSGPLAGFVIGLATLFYGFTHLPEPEYIFQFHPEYEQYGLNYADHVYENQKENTMDLTIGKNLIFLFFETYVADPERVPNPHEVMHYPVIFAGFLALVFTFLNLFPVGQLDGGRVIYGLFGYRVHRIIASVFFVGLLLYSGLGLVTPNTPNLIWVVPISIGFLYVALTGLGLPQRDTLMYSLVIFAVLFALASQFPELKGYSGWLVFILVIGRFVGVRHPPTQIEEPLDSKRIFLGWLTLIIFILCFAPAPLNITLTTAKP
jgi:membrane-associated protease RseP (regulator of RpoE activity)